MKLPYKFYLITDDSQNINTLLSVVEKAVAGGVTMVQVREKHGDVRVFIERAQAVKKMLAGSDVPLVINDRLDVALAVDADGLHLGQADMPADTARALLGKDKLLGLSVENEQQLMVAQALPIDYVGVGAIFPTLTKANTKKEWGIKGLAQALALTKLPVVAIGGINLENLKAVCKTGVDGVALVSLVCSAKDTYKRSQIIAQKLSRYEASPPH